MYDGVWDRTVGQYGRIRNGMGVCGEEAATHWVLLTDEFFEIGEGEAKEEEKYMY